MTIRDGIVEAIGHTPLIKLKAASEATSCTILGKAEFMNPGGSVKDRAGRQMILKPKRAANCAPGGLVVEATAGNTGIGLALVANARGYRTLIVIPETQSQEKKDMLRMCGAELVEVPAVAYSNPDNYQHVGRRLAEQLKKTEKNGVIFADQWNNPDNRKAHYVSTGPEIWQQTDGKIDGFICTMGTGGTIAGVATFLREKNKSIVIGVARSARRRQCTICSPTARPKASEGGSITEGAASAWAASRRSSRRSRSTRPISRRRGSVSKSIIFDLLGARRPSARRLVRHQCLPAPSGWPKDPGPALARS